MLNSKSNIKHIVSYRNIKTICYLSKGYMLKIMLIRLRINYPSKYYKTKFTVHLPIDGSLAPNLKKTREHKVQYLVIL